ncbi:ERAP1-like C-terminal domain-containing protein [Nocardioides sp. SYSU D00038]|uniref:ERAP1-like C-terminal domain-containing protein n=1 Tax=Nocardioides sp. SYSU D00038 TaxID=2812554 RepID=UPI0019676F97|nr:ERAP1-like C-terminal domain-containing protein [Nocardioides sp. SYSU D00038]
MSQASTLTLEEARERASYLTVERYDLVVDVRGMRGADVWSAESRITFTCRPGARTFVECAGEVLAATLNGVAIDLEQVRRGRIPLSRLAARNVLVVSSTASAAHASVRRFVDPSDNQTYVWTAAQPDAAGQAWACFDQPDLKAVHRLTVHAPGDWTVVTGTAPDEVRDLDDGGRSWVFAETPRLPSYAVGLHAGPFHEVRREHGEHDLGFYCRGSVRDLLDRDADELARVTGRGLDFLRDHLGRSLGRYDQVFVPGLRAGLAHWGGVTLGDDALHRGTPTPGDRAAVADEVLGNLARSWFGGQVTPAWWDELWLSEALTAWVAAIAGSGDLPGFVLGGARRGRLAELAPTRHPLRADVPDARSSYLALDTLTRETGRAVVHQLAVTVGTDRLLAGLRHYLAGHSGGTATAADLLAAIAADAPGELADGSDLDGPDLDGPDLDGPDLDGPGLDEWGKAWFDTAGGDTLTLVDHTLLVTGPDGAPGRPHRLVIGSYRLEQDGALVRVARTDVDAAAPTTDLSTELPEADVRLVNDDALTWAATRTDERSLTVLLGHAERLAEPVSRALAVGSAWDLLLRGELSSGELFDLVVRTAAAEPDPALLEALLVLGLEVAEHWTARGLVPRRLGRLAEVALARCDDETEPVAALRALAWTASRPEHFEALDAATGGDVDLAWRVLARRASLGRDLPSDAEALTRRDPHPETWVRALWVTAARPDPAAKDEVWEQLFRTRRVPVDAQLPRLAACFWRPVQHALLLPYARRYLEEAEALSRTGGPGHLLLLRAMTPTVVDEEYVEAALSLAGRDGLSPGVRAVVLEAADLAARMLRARS